MPRSGFTGRLRTYRCRWRCAGPPLWAVGSCRSRTMFGALRWLLPPSFAAHPLPARFWRARRWLRPFEAGRL